MSRPHQRVHERSGRRSFSSGVGGFCFVWHSIILVLFILVLGMLFTQLTLAQSRSKPAECETYGKIQVFEAFPDAKVQVVEAFPDIRVQRVPDFANSPGKWQIVDPIADWKVQIVDAFPDYKIHWVAAFPGCE
jgi:hypothetical protein